jgi:hypothetical protein
MQSGLDQKPVEVTPDKIIPILSRPRQTKTTLQQNSPTPSVLMPIAEGLAFRFGVISDDTLTILDDEKLAKLSLSKEMLVKQSLRNIEDEAKVNATPFPGEVAVHQVFGRYASAGLLTRKHAAIIKAQLNLRELAVTFPRRGMTLIADASDKKAIARLREIASRFLQPESAMISREVYLVTDGSLAIMPETQRQ